MKRSHLALTVVLSQFVTAKTYAAIATPSISADQALGALAEVITDRAKQVASEVLQNNLVDAICGRTVALSLGSKTSETLSLRFGGSKSCRSNANTCNGDDVFVQSCKLMKDLNFTITDPSLLKTVARESISFTLRVAGGGLDQQHYDGLGIDLLADYVYDLGEELKAGRLDSKLIVSETVDLTNKLSARQGGGLTDKINSSLRSVPDLTVFLAGVWNYQEAQCPPPVMSAECAYHRLFAKPSDLSGATHAEICRRFAGQVSSGASNDRDNRSEAFGVLFGPGSPYLPAQDVPCSSLSVLAPASIPACMVGELSRLLDPLYKVVCSDVVPLGPREVRQLTYVFYKEPDIYADALGAAAGNLGSYFLKLRNGITDVLAQNGGAGAVGTSAFGAMLNVLMTAIQADQSSGDALKSFLNALETDGKDAAAAFLSVAKAGTFTCHGQIVTPKPTDIASVASRIYGTCILQGNALRWDKRNGWYASRDVGQFRDAVKSLAALPLFVAVLSSERTVSLDVSIVGKSIQIVKSLVQGLDDLRSQPGKPSLTASDLVEHTAELLGLLDSLTPLAKSVTSGDTTLIDNLHRSLFLGHDLLQGAANQDWVGMALTGIIDIIPEQSDSQLAGALQFIHVLMTVYQAKTQDEAKAAFQAALEQTGSRKERFGHTAVDVSALFGAGGGVQVDWTGASNSNMGGAYGLFVPFGLQLTDGHVGGMLYPIDLGAYLSSASAGTHAPPTKKVALSDAARFGGAFLVRFSRSVPVVLAIGADYRPPIGTESQQFRAEASLALELPLFMIH